MKKDESTTVLPLGDKFLGKKCESRSIVYLGFKKGQKNTVVVKSIGMKCFIY